MSFKKIISIVILALFFYFGKKLLLPKPDSFEDKMNQMVKEVNVRCPFQIDKYTTADSVSYNSLLNEFIYSYSVSAEAQNVTVDMVNNTLRPALTNKVKSEKSFEFIRRHDITVVFKYYDKHNEIAARIPIKPEIYNNN